MIVIIDYGMGNLRSVQKGFEKVGYQAAVTSDPAVVAAANKLVLPGVGAFADAMLELRRRELVKPILSAIDAGKPVLGICLGMQLLFERSYENGEHEGLGVLAGEVVRFAGATFACAGPHDTRSDSAAPSAPAERWPGRLPVPHMGWNQLRLIRPAPLLTGLADGTYVYFVHSYYVVPRDRGIVATETDYPAPFCSTIWRENIYATQFHPEKSQAAGLQILGNFAAFRG
jgi:glutamine amidotransferase